jgi:hypothetical protein
MKSYGAFLSSCPSRTKLKEERVGNPGFDSGLHLRNHQEYIGPRSMAEEVRQAIIEALIERVSQGGK